MQIKRPQSSRYIRIWQIEGDGSNPQEFNSFDTSSDRRVSIVNRTVIFYLTQENDRLQLGANNYITMERGAVVGLQSCAGSGAPSPAIVDPMMWRFKAGRD